MRMIALVACLLVLACGTGSRENTLVDVELIELQGLEEQNWPFGRFDVQYGVRVTNRSQEAVTLHQIALETPQPGPYALYRDRYTLDRTVAPSATEDVTFWARARALVGRDSVQAHAPVTVRVVTYFRAPSGEFQKIQLVTIR